MEDVDADVAEAELLLCILSYFQSGSGAELKHIYSIWDFMHAPELAWKKDFIHYLFLELQVDSWITTPWSFNCSKVVPCRVYLTTLTSNYFNSMSCTALYGNVCMYINSILFISTFQGTCGMQITIQTTEFAKNKEKKMKSYFPCIFN